MNDLHENDKRNRYKQAKMIRRKDRGWKPTPGSKCAKRWDWLFGEDSGDE